MTDSFDVVFYGNSDSECIDFIRAVRQHAKDNGKIRDNIWIADELFNAFSGKALKWYVLLPVDVRSDWERLQQALVTRWMKDENEDNLGSGVSSLAILPTAAAAPAPSLPNTAPSIASTATDVKEKVGRVRIRANGVTETQYLATNVVPQGEGNRSGTFNTTTAAASALKVRLIPTAPDLCRLELVEHDSGLSVLAVFNYGSDHWKYITSPSATDSYLTSISDADCWGFLIGLDMPGLGALKDHRTTYNVTDTLENRQFWTDRWQILNTGALKLCGPVDAADTARFALGVSIRGQDDLWFASPKTSMYSYSVEAGLEFEPLDK